MCDYKKITKTDGATNIFVAFPLISSFGVRINLSKSSFNVLQAATIANPRTQMRLVAPTSHWGIYLCGYTCRSSALHENIHGRPAHCSEWWISESSSPPIPSGFPSIRALLLQPKKIVHLLRHLGPQILDSAQRFDIIINQLAYDYYDLRLQSQAPMSLHDITANLPSFAVTQMEQLARVQTRSLPLDSGLDLVSMSATAISAFYAAHFRHF